MRVITCTPRVLDPERARTAIRRAIDMSIGTSETMRAIERNAPDARRGLRRLALLVDRRWPKEGMTFSVQFLDGPSAELRRTILRHMNAWNKTANVKFTETRGTGMVRIARYDEPKDMAGYWSYVGTEILGIPEDEPTMNLEGFTMRLRESEMIRVVRHEAGHTLGFDHEHMRSELVARIDPKKAFPYYERTEGWSRKVTLEQVLTPLAKKSIMGTTEADPLSIMCYDIPAEITKDGKAIVGGSDINEKDHAFAARIYPKPRTAKRTEDAPVKEPHASGPPRPAPQATSTYSDTFGLVVLDEAAAGQKEPVYARVLASYGGARVTNMMRLRKAGDEQATLFGRIIGTHERIKKYTNKASGKLPEESELIRLGTDLFDTLFQGEVRRLYDEARARQQHKKLDLILTSMIPWIADKPWEFAYDKDRRSFLATEDVHLVRNVLTAIPADAIAPRPGPMRILVASAQPVGYGSLSVEQEAEVIRRGFNELADAGAAKVEVVARITPGALHELLSTGSYNIVHFIGHGEFDEKKQEGVLLFEGERGGAQRIGERSAREIFCQRGIDLVFLNACQTGQGGRADFNKGVAQSLVAHGLPALVANQYSVLDSSATSFARHFYWSLARGMSIGSAAREARIAVNYSLQGEAIDWAVPVVYARDPNAVLCTGGPVAEGAPAKALERRAKSRTSDRTKRVAVWDIDGAFPKLASTCERLNQAQEHFGFEVVNLSAPVDTWDLETPSPDGTRYLNAARLARRMEGIPAELGVDVLACITRHWMCDDDDTNLFGWWPDEGIPPVLAFSFAGFEELRPEGPATDRAIANLLVSGLAGWLSGMGSHERGAKDCPMYYNPERDLELMTDVQRFDKSCRQKLKRELRDEFPALEKLLNTFK